MNKEEIFQNAIEHYIDYDLFGIGFGIGQIDIKTIMVMIEIGKELDLTFWFAKKVTAIDDEDCKERTITALSNHLFVYPSKLELGEFWEKVNSKKKENN